jgi:hypothetical protein
VQLVRRFGILLPRHRRRGSALRGNVRRGGHLHPQRPSCLARGRVRGDVHDHFWDNDVDGDEDARSRCACGRRRIAGNDFDFVETFASTSFVDGGDDDDDDDDDDDGGDDDDGDDDGGGDD